VNCNSLFSFASAYRHQICRGKKAPETADRDEHNLDNYVPSALGRAPRKEYQAGRCRGLGFTVLASIPQGKARTRSSGPRSTKSIRS